MGCPTLRIKESFDRTFSNVLLIYKWNDCVLNLGTTFENPVLSQDFTPLRGAPRTIQGKGELLSE